MDFLKSFHLRLLEECLWLPSDSEGTERWGCLKKSADRLHDGGENFLLGVLGTL